MDAPVESKDTRPWVIWALIALLATGIGWHQSKFDQLPETYVRLERYRQDQGDLKEQLKSIGAKLDMLIEREMRE